MERVAVLGGAGGEGGGVDTVIVYGYVMSLAFLPVSVLFSMIYVIVYDA